MRNINAESELRLQLLRRPSDFGGGIYDTQPMYNRAMSAPPPNESTRPALQPHQATGRHFDISTRSFPNTLKHFKTFLNLSNPPMRLKYWISVKIPYNIIDPLKMFKAV